jgi:hypothetical protein
MKNLDIPHVTSPRLLHLVVLAFFAFCGTAVQAQAPQQTLKVSAPADAKPMAKDSVDNFVSFSPVYVEGKTYVRWLVENDKKDGVFIVERSEDGDSFEALAFKDRVGTDKSIRLFYSWVDENPPAGQAHYRIMQVGNDHTYNYSATVKVKTGAVPNSTGSASSEPAEKK